MKFVYASSTIADGNFSSSLSLEKVKPQRNKFLDSLGLSGERKYIQMEVAHSNQISLVDTNNLDQAEVKVDGLICQNPRIVLGLLTADCVPLIWHHQSGWFGVVHIGWESGFMGVLRQNIQICKQVLGKTEIKNVSWFLGPHIRKNSYQHTTRPQQYNQVDWQNAVEYCSSSQVWQVDMTRFVVDQLLDHDANPDLIEDCGVDTFLSDNHFSHYGARRTNQPQGRMLTVVGVG